MKLATRLLCMGLVVASVSTCFARGPFYSESVPARSTRKFARGFANTIFFWAEIPKEVNRDWQNVDPLTGVVTGTGKGLYKGAQRFGAGIYEMVTFTCDKPALYQPIVYPELVLEDGYDWGAEEYYHEQRTSKLPY